MSAESGLKALQRSARRIARARGFELSEIENLVWSDRVPYLGSDIDPKIIGEQVKDNGIEWVIFDPLYLMLDGKDAGNLYSQGVQFRRLHDACREAGADFKLVHHLTRAASKVYEPPTLNDASWAGIAEFVGQWWLVGRRERYMPGSGLHKLWLELGARGEHQNGWAVDVDEHADDLGRPQGWTVTVRPAVEAQSGEASDKTRQKDEASDRQLQADREAIVKTLSRFVDGETMRHIRDRARVKPARFSTAWASLLDDGSIAEAGEVKRGNGQRYSTFKLEVQADV
jgi:hypothetical protein